MHAVVFAPVLVTVAFVSLVVWVNTFTWVRASWPLTHGQAGSRWQRGAGCSTSRSSVAICNATVRAASAFCCWLCLLFFSKESPPSLDFDPGLLSFDGSSKMLFYIDAIVSSLRGFVPQPLRPLRRHLRPSATSLTSSFIDDDLDEQTAVATSRWLLHLYY